VLVIATEGVIYLLPVTFGVTGGTSEAMTVHFDPDLVITGTAAQPTKVAGTSDGRIFLGAADGTLTELEYSTAREHSASFAAALGLAKRARPAAGHALRLDDLTSWGASLLGVAPPAILDMAVDHARRLLYTLDRAGTVAAHTLSPGSPPARFATIEGTALRAGMPHELRDASAPSAPLSLHVVDPSDSAAVHLIVLLRSGDRVFLTTGSSRAAPPSIGAASAARPNGLAGSGTSMRCAHSLAVVRYLVAPPPAAVTEDADGAASSRAAAGPRLVAVAAACSGGDLVLVRRQDRSAAGASPAPAALMAAGLGAAPAAADWDSIEVTAASHSPWRRSARLDRAAAGGKPKPAAGVAQLAELLAVPGADSVARSVAVAEEPQATFLVTDASYAPSGALLLPGDLDARPETAPVPVRGASDHARHASVLGALGAYEKSNGTTGLRVLDHVLDNFPVTPAASSARLVHRARRMELDELAAARGKPALLGLPLGLRPTVGLSDSAAQAVIGRDAKTFVLVSSAGVHRFVRRRPADIVSLAIRERPTGHAVTSRGFRSGAAPAFTHLADAPVRAIAVRLGQLIRGMGRVETVAAMCLLFAEADERSGEQAVATEGGIAAGASSSLMRSVTDCAYSFCADVAGRAAGPDGGELEAAIASYDVTTSPASSTMRGVALHFSRVVRHVWGEPLLAVAAQPDPDMLGDTGAPRPSVWAAASGAAGGYLVARFSTEELDAVASRLESLARFVGEAYRLDRGARVEPYTAAAPPGADARDETSRDPRAREAREASSVCSLCARAAQALRAVSLLVSPGLGGMPCPIALHRLVPQKDAPALAASMTLRALAAGPAPDEAPPSSSSSSSPAAPRLSSLLSAKIQRLRREEVRSHGLRERVARLVSDLATRCPVFFSTSDDSLNRAKHLVRPDTVGAEAGQRDSRAADAVRMVESALATAWASAPGSTLDELGDVAMGIAGLGSVDRALDVLVKAERAASDASAGPAAWSSSSSSSSSSSALVAAAPEDPTALLARMDLVAAAEEGVDWLGLRRGAVRRLPGPGHFADRRDLASVWRRVECSRVLVRWLLTVGEDVLCPWAARVRADRFGAASAHAVALPDAIATAVQRVLELRPTTVLVLTLCRLADERRLTGASSAVRARCHAIDRALHASHSPAVTAFLRARTASGDNGVAGARFDSLVHHLELQGAFEEAANETAARALAAAGPGSDVRLPERRSRLRSALALAARSPRPLPEPSIAQWRSALDLLAVQDDLAKVAAARAELAAGTAEGHALAEIHAKLDTEAPAARTLVGAARRLGAVHSFLRVHVVVRAAGADASVERAFGDLLRSRAEQAERRVGAEAARLGTSPVAHWTRVAPLLAGSSASAPDLPDSLDVASSLALLLTHGVGSGPDLLYRAVVTLESVASTVLAGASPAEIMASVDAWGLVSVAVLDAVQHRVGGGRAEAAASSAASFAGRLATYSALLRENSRSVQSLQQHLIRSLYALVAAWLARAGTGRDAASQHTDSMTEALRLALGLLDSAPAVRHDDGTAAATLALKVRLTELAADVEDLHSRHDDFL